MELKYLSIENHAREYIAALIDEELWNRKLWKPPQDCLNRNKKDLKRIIIHGKSE